MSKSAMNAIKGQSVKGIEFNKQHGNKQIFLHLDQDNAVGWFGWLFISDLKANAWVSWRKATDKELLNIIRNFANGQAYRYKYTEISGI